MRLKSLKFSKIQGTGPHRHRASKVLNPRFSGPGDLLPIEHLEEFRSHQNSLVVSGGLGQF